MASAASAMCCSRWAATARPVSDRDRLAQCRRPDGFSETRFSYHVYTATEKLLKPKLQACKVEQRSPRVDGDKEVDVTPLALLAPSDRAEHADVTRATVRGSAADILSQFEE